MAGGLAALLDDVALIAKAAAASTDDIAAAAARTSAKAAGVVIDDAAVTPQFVAGVTPARELPIIAKIAKGSLFNKLIIILPVALLLSQLAPWALQPLLTLGGVYLSFEGAEKIWCKISGHEPEAAAAAQGPEAEKKLVSGAIRTDLILSAEIMVIALDQVTGQQLWFQAITLIVVGLVITGGVYGAVGALVKMDDVGLALTRKPATARLGRLLVAAMPKVLTTIAYVGTAAMLWVGGHLVVSGIADFGFDGPHHLVEHLAHSASHPALQWLIETGCSMVAGLIVGGAVVAVMELIHKVSHKATHE